MGELTGMLERMLDHAARMLPPERRQWAEAVQAEAGQVAPGWPRLRWLAGGLWLVTREAAMMRKAGYWLGTGVVAAAAAWVMWLSWRTSPATDPQAVTDRVRVLVGVAALVVLPWVGRRRGWFGPVGSSLAARLVRVAGCAAVCGLGVAVVRMDGHLGVGPGSPGPFSMLREITALVLVGAALTTLAVVKARWPDAEPSAIWSAAVFAGLLVFFAVPLQALAIVYVAGILAATSRRSPVTTASLAAGTVAGLVTGGGFYEIASAVQSDKYVGVLVLGLLATVFLLAGLAGAAAAWLLSGTEDPNKLRLTGGLPGLVRGTGDSEKLRLARGMQGLLAGSVAGAVCGLLLTDFFVVAVFMMVMGPVVGAAGGTIGGFHAADHPLKSRPARSWAAGVFVRF